MSYTVPGAIEIMGQPTRMTCWAAVGAMMMNWRAMMCRTIGDAMSEAGATWAQLFARGRGLAASQHRQFANDCGMRTEPMMCLPFSTWESMLRRHGPLAVVTANPFHARIMRGLATRGRNQFVLLIDPGGPRRYEQDFIRFTRDFEDVASSPRCQVWHY